MEINKILTADFLDLLFEGRNKEYGAYDLRKTYNKRMTKAIVAMLCAVLLIFLSSFILELTSKKAVTQTEAPEIELDKFKEEKKPEPPPPPPPPKQPEPPKIEVAKFTPPKIVKDEEVKKEDEIKEIKEIENKTTGTFDQKGEATEAVQPVVAPSTGAPAPVEEDYNKVYTTVEIEASFPGGTEAWKRHLTRNLNAELPRENGATPGRYTVIVSFIVDRAGNISDVHGAFQGGGEDFGTVAEAEKVIKNGPRWTPAIQNGLNVISRKSQPITFVISEE